MAVVEAEAEIVPSSYPNTFADQDGTVFDDPERTSEQNDDVEFRSDVGLIRQDGGGATLVRQELARHPERLRGVKVLVWEFAERDLLAAETEWAKVELPR